MGYDQCYKTFHFTIVRNKLECLSLAILSSLVQCLLVKQEPTLLKNLSGDLLQAGKVCQGQKLQLITKIRKLRTKKFYNIGPSSTKN